VRITIPELPYKIFAGCLVVFLFYISVSNKLVLNTAEVQIQLHPAAKPYPTSEDNREGVATICPKALLVRGIKSRHLCYS